MTFHHFVNCLVLCFVPHYLYYSTSLRELGSGFQYLYILAGYIVTAFLRLLVEGIIFTEQSLLRDLFGAVLGGFDLLALWLLLNRRPSFLMIGFGWSIAESLAMRLVPLWIGSRGPQFDYQYLQIAFESNLSLVYYISIAFLIYTIMKKKEFQNVKLLQAILLFALILQPILAILSKNKSILVGFVSLNPGLVLKTVWVASLGYYSKSLHSAT